MVIKRTFLRSFLMATALGAGALLIGGCGGGGGKDDDDGNGNGNGTPPTPAEAQAAAAASMAKAINTNGAMLTTLGQNSSAVGELLELAGIDTDGSSGVGVFTHDGGAEEDVFDDLEGLIGASLGLSGNPSVTTTGDLITIDPDDTRVCMQEILGSGATQEDLAECVQIVSHLTVTILATSSTAGTVTFLYDDLRILAVTYTSNSAAFEIFLADLAAIAQSLEEISSDPDDEPLDLPDTFEGALQLSLAVTNDTAGQEAGSIGLAVTQTITIADEEDEVSISLGPSTLLSLSGDAGAGTATVSAALGALAATFPVEDPFDVTHDGALTIGGLSAQATLSDAGDTLVVTEFGIAPGTPGIPPFYFTVDGQNALSLGLALMGFTIDGANDTITLDAALDFDLAAANVAGVLDDFFGNPFQPDLTATLEIDAPANTVFTVLGDPDETLQLTTGGPLTATGTGVLEGGVEIQAGQCLDSPDEENGTGGFPILLVDPCPAETD